MNKYEAIFMAAAFFNMGLNVIMLAVLGWGYWKTRGRFLASARIQEQFAEVYWRMDKASVVNAQALDERIIERTNDLNNRLNYIARWQKITAKMIRDNQNQNRARKES